MPSNLDALTEIARAATQGEWHSSMWRVFIKTDPHPADPGETIARTAGELFSALDNTRHIATFGPPTILALLAELREARALMREAAGELEEDARLNYPLREHYPSIMKDYERAMDIVRRLRAAAGGGE